MISWLVGLVLSQIVLYAVFALSGAGYALSWLGVAGWRIAGIWIGRVALCAALVLSGYQWSEDRHAAQLALDKAASDLRDRTFERDTALRDLSNMGRVSAKAIDLQTKLNETEGELTKKGAEYAAEVQRLERLARNAKGGKSCSPSVIDDRDIEWHRSLRKLPELRW